MHRKSLIVLTVVAASTAVAAAATPPARGRQVSRTAQGADGQSGANQSTRTQPVAAKSIASQSVAERFEQLDRNHDGFLSRDEANDAHELDTRFSELDVNNDGKLSRDEYRVVSAGETATLPGAASAATGATRH
jgi:hypothetical protein